MRTMRLVRPLKKPSMAFPSPVGPHRFWPTSRFHRVFQRTAITTIMALSAILPLLSACAYNNRVAPIRLPEAAANMVEVNGLKMTATAFVNHEAAEKAFGFDIRKAGLLPIQVTFENDGSSRVKVKAKQTFLVDDNHNAWPVMDSRETYARTKKFVDIGETVKGSAKPSLLMGAAGAVAGLAIGIVSGENIGEMMGKGAAIGAAAGAISGGADAYARTGRRIRDDLARKTLKNDDIMPGQIAYGVLFFPGFPKDEAASAKELRLSLDFGYSSSRVVTISLDGGRNGK